VRKETCADVAREIDLGAVLRLGKSEMATGGRRKQALLGDAMEAVIAAVYLDARVRGGARHDPAPLGHALTAVDADARDAKTALQEWAQARGLAPPTYVEIASTGPDHAPVFTMEARLDTGQTARAEGRVKRHAEQAAARDLLARLGGACDAELSDAERRCRS
jgi:ribonuclease-3